MKIRGYKLIVLLVVIWVVVQILLGVITKQLGFDTDFFSGYFTAMLFFYWHDKTKLYDINEVLRQAKDLRDHLQRMKDFNSK